MTPKPQIMLLLLSLVASASAFGSFRVNAITSVTCASNDPDDQREAKQRRQRKRRSSSSHKKSSSDESSSWLDGFELEEEFAAHASSSSDDDLCMQKKDTALDSFQTHPLLQVPCSFCLSGSKRSTPIRAFCDTGAQLTVMSYDCASRQGLLQHLDRRYAGRAMGVGSCGIVGRIPAGIGTLQMGDAALPSPAITVLESSTDANVELLLGLDFLREHAAILNLRDGELLLRVDQLDVRVPFIKPRSNNNSGGRGGGSSRGGAILPEYLADRSRHENSNSNCNDDWESEDEEDSDDAGDIDMSGV